MPDVADGQGREERRRARPKSSKILLKEILAMIRILLSTRLGERRMTQKALSEATGIRGQTINDLYHEMADRVSLEDLDLICEALDCELSDLMTREPNPVPTVKFVRRVSDLTQKLIDHRKKVGP